MKDSSFSLLIGVWRGCGARLVLVEAKIAASAMAHLERIMQRARAHLGPLSEGSSRPSGRLRPQPLTDHDVMGQRVPQREGFGVDQAANRDQAEAVVLAIRMDPPNGSIRFIAGVRREASFSILIRA